MSAKNLLFWGGIVLSLLGGGCQTATAPAGGTGTTGTTTATTTTAAPTPATVAVAATPKPAETPKANPDYVIEPGYKIGKIAIDMERPKVHELLGRPLTTYTLNGVVIDNWGSNKSDNFVQVYYRANKAAQIEVSSPKFATKEGVSTKSTLAQVQKSFKKLNKTTHRSEGEGEDSELRYFDDSQLGITFVFIEDKGFTIMVHKPGEDAILNQEAE